MPDSKKITIKTKVTINTISDDVDARDRHQRSPHLSSSHRDANRSSLNDDEGQNSHNGESRRNSSRSRGKRVSNAENIESINLQENSQRPVQLKASFLRRKMKEYEGNETFSFLSKNYFTLQVCLSSMSHSLNVFFNLHVKGV